MASKGQKFGKYSNELKEKIIKEYLDGIEGYTSLSQKYGVPHKTIEMWIDKVKYPQRYPSLGQKKGRPKDSNTDWKEKYEILKKYQAFLKAQRERK